MVWWGFVELPGLKAPKEYAPLAARCFVAVAVAVAVIEAAAAVAEIAVVVERECLVPPSGPSVHVNSGRIRTNAPSEAWARPADAPDPDGMAAAEPPFSLMSAAMASAHASSSEPPSSWECATGPAQPSV